MNPASRWFGEAEKLHHLCFVSFPNGQNTLLCKALKLNILKQKYKKGQHLS